MSFPRYPAYKESGVEWLGEVPVEWDVMRLSRKLERLPCYGVLVPEYVDEGVPMLRINDIEHGLANRQDLKKISAQQSNEYSRSLLEEGDIALAVVGTIGRSLIVGNDLAGCNLSRAVAKVRTNNDLSAQMLRWVFESLPFKCYTDLVCVGAAQRVLNMNTLASFYVAIPSCNEQSSIDHFLTRETAKIDALIAEQQRLIELLQEKRQAVISHAVTKGLNPNAPMNDSGVEWLGEVPKHWEITKLGWVSTSKCDGPFGSGLKSDHYVEQGIRVVRLQNIKSSGFDDGSAAFIDPGYYARALGEHDVFEADLLVAGLGDDNNLVGRSCVAPASILPAMVKADCFRFRLNREVALPDFISFSLNTSARVHGQTLSTGTTRSRIPLSVMAHRELALPPVEEQQKIEELLKSELETFSALRIQAEGALTLLSERRSALISAAVTGQIDVRGLMPEAVAV